MCRNIRTLFNFEPPATEEEIRASIADAKRLWKQGPRHEQASLFAEPGEKARQGEMRLDLSGITDEQFWERAEHRAVVIHHRDDRGQRRGHP